MQLRTQNLTKNFGNRCAVDHVSLNFERGVYGLLGPNGAGKTTLMRMMVGVLPPSSGKVTLDGVTIGELGAKYRDILGYMPRRSVTTEISRQSAFCSTLGHSKGWTQSTQTAE